MASADTLNIGSGLRIEYEVIEYESYGPEPDPTWKHIDAAGHGHFYKGGYPTLREVTETKYDVDDNEEYEVHVRWECPHCGEAIRPATQESFGRGSVRGAARYLMDGNPVSKDEFKVLWRKAAIKRLDDQMKEL